MSLNISGLEHYQAHQQFHQADTRTGAAEKTVPSGESARHREDDAVSVSDAVAVLEWVAAQAPDIASARSTEPANLGRLTGHLLQYNLITLQDAGRLMQLSAPAEAASEDSLLARIQTHSTGTDHYRESQSWQKLNRIVNNVHAAQ